MCHFVRSLIAFVCQKDYLLTYLLTYLLLRQRHLLPRWGRLACAFYTNSRRREALWSPVVHQAVRRWSVDTVKYSTLSSYRTSCTVLKIRNYKSIVSKLVKFSSSSAELINQVAGYIYFCSRLVLETVANRVTLKRPLTWFYNEDDVGLHLDRVDSLCSFLSSSYR